MSSDQNPSADAVLLAILGFLVARGVGNPNASMGEAVPDVLSPDGLAIACQVVKEANEVEAHIFAIRHGATLDDAVFHDYRATIDGMWAYVKEYGLEALAKEADKRVEMAKRARAS